MNTSRKRGPTCGSTSRKSLSTRASSRSWIRADLLRGCTRNKHEFYSGRISSLPANFLPPLRDCVVIPETSPRLALLSFRPQGEILDPSHSFGMTIRFSVVATQPLDGGRLRWGCCTRHQHRGALDLAGAESMQSFIGVFQWESLHFASHGNLRRERQKFFAVAPREIGDRTDRAFFPQYRIGKRRNVAHVDTAADHDSSFADGAQGLGNKVTHRSEDNCGIKLDRRQFV